MNKEDDKANYSIPRKEGLKEEQRERIPDVPSENLQLIGEELKRFGSEILCGGKRQRVLAVIEKSGAIIIEEMGR